jgi:CelD/BcsL family acetyltransferase involved in cellulose biosynthesis
MKNEKTKSKSEFTNDRSMKISVVRDLDGMKALETEWNYLFDGAKEKFYFYGFSWNWQACRHIVKKRRLRPYIIVGRVDGRVVLIWPLVIGRLFVWQVVKWLGSQTLEYHDVLVRDEPDKHRWMAIAWSYLCSETRADAVLLECVRDSAEVASILGQQQCTVRLYDYAPFVDWRDWKGWPRYYSSLSRNLRSDHRRQLKRLEAIGALSFEHVESEATCRNVVEWMFVQKQMWSESKGTEQFWTSVPEYPAFLKAAVETAHKSGNLFIATLKQDEILIAALFGFCTESNLALWKMTYDSNWETYSPGRVLWIKALEWSRDAGHKVCDFMPRAYPFKYRFTKKDVAVRMYYIPRTFWGHFFVLLHAYRLRNILHPLANFIRRIT